MKALLLGVLTFALVLLGFGAWRVLGLRAEAETLRQRNADARRATQKTEAELRSLESGRAAIGVVHARLVDSSVPPELTAPSAPAVPGAPRRDSAPAFKLPAPFEVLQREGARWRFAAREVPAGDRSRSVRGEATAEFHRLLPLLAAMENLFPLVSTDELTLALPPGASAFVAQATPLQIEASFRVPLRSGSAAGPEKR